MATGATGTGNGRGAQVRAEISDDAIHQVASNMLALAEVMPVGDVSRREVVGRLMPTLFILKTKKGMTYKQLYTLFNKTVPTEFRYNTESSFKSAYQDYLAAGMESFDQRISERISQVNKAVEEAARLTRQGRIHGEAAQAAPDADGAGMVEGSGSGGGARGRRPSKAAIAMKDFHQHVSEVSAAQDALAAGVKALEEPVKSRATQALDAARAIKAAKAQVRQHSPEQATQALLASLNLSLSPVAGAETEAGVDAGIAQGGAAEPAGERAPAGTARRPRPQAGTPVSGSDAGGAGAGAGAQREAGFASAAPAAGQSQTSDSGRSGHGDSRGSDHRTMPPEAGSVSLPAAASAAAPAAAVPAAAGGLGDALTCITQPSFTECYSENDTNVARRGRDFFSTKILMHPRIPGLMLTREQRLYKGKLIYSSQENPSVEREETTSERIGRLNWKAPQDLSIGIGEIGQVNRDLLKPSAENS